jgi:hypothetical protein
MLPGFRGYPNKRITPIKSIDPIQLIDTIYRAENRSQCDRSSPSITLLPSATHRAVDAKHDPGGGRSADKQLPVPTRVRFHGLRRPRESLRPTRRNDSNLSVFRGEQPRHVDDQAADNDARGEPEPRIAGNVAVD